MIKKVLCVGESDIAELAGLVAKCVRYGINASMEIRSSGSEYLKDCIVGINGEEFEFNIDFSTDNKYSIRNYKTLRAAIKKINNEFDGAERLLDAIMNSGNCEVESEEPDAEVAIIPLSEGGDGLSQSQC